MNILHDLYWNLGFHLELRDGQLCAVGSGKASLPDEHRRWIAEHKQLLIDALELRNNPNCCWICGQTGVAEIRASHPDLDALGPRWYCEIHIPNTDTREAVALAMWRYRKLETTGGSAYHEARNRLIRAQVEQDLEEGIVNPWGWDTSWLPKQLRLEIAA